MAIFGKEEVPQKASPTRSESRTDPRSLLGPGLVLEGKLMGDEPVLIEGEVRGSVNLTDSVHIGPQARVVATVHGRCVMIEGMVQGDVSAEERVELVATARVEGNIRAPRVIVAEGAQFQGSVDMGARKKEPAPQNQRSEESFHVGRSQ